MNENKVKFYSLSNLPKIKKVEVGSKIVKEFGAKIDPKTKKVVVGVVRSFDIVEQIQSYRKETDIYYLLQKYQNGDINALNQKDVFYEDVSEMPSSLIQMTNEIQRLEGQFSLLPKEFKDKYNLKNVSDYLNALISGKFFEKENLKEKDIKENNKDVVNNEVKEND